MNTAVNKDELKVMRTKLVVKPDTAFITAEIQLIQYLNNQVVDNSLLQLDDEFGKELADYVKKCDPN